MMTFTLGIRLGNDAMQTPHDVAAVLRKVADRLDVQAGLLGAVREESSIRDLNGNTVGEWVFAEDE
jgi:hypothetical protein